MNKKSELFFDELIKLERNAQNIYLLFSIKLDDYKNFWYNLSLEESNHASLLEISKLYYDKNIDNDMFINHNITSDIIKINKSFDILIDNFLLDSTINNAINIAIEIESSVGERCYENLFNKYNKDNEIYKLFRYLNEEDTNHLNIINELQNKIEKDNI